MFDLSISVSISVTVLLYLGELTMELSHAQRRSTMVNKIWLFGIQLGENPPSVHTYIRTSALHVNACEMSQLLARSPRHIQFVFNVILGIHVMVNWELSKKVSANHMTVSRAQVNISLSWRVFQNYPLKSYWCLIDRRLRSFFQEEFSLPLAYGESWITWERYFSKDPMRASLLALAKSI